MAIHRFGSRTTGYIRFSKPYGVAGFDAPIRYASAAASGQIRIWTFGHAVYSVSSKLVRPRDHLRCGDVRQGRSPQPQRDVSRGGDIEVVASSEVTEGPQGPAGPPSSRYGWLSLVGSLVLLAVVAFAFHELHLAWRGFHYRDLLHALGQIGPAHLLLALAFTGASYLCNAAIGILGERWLQHPPHDPVRDLGRNFIASAFTINAGGSLVGGGSIRLRFAVEGGLRPAEAGKLTLFCSAAGWGGNLLLCGLLLTLATPPALGFPSHWIRGVGAVLAVAGILMPFGALLSPRTWPAPSIAWLAVLTATLDWLFAGLAMWALFPASLSMGVFAFVGTVMVAQSLAALSHVPGGVGVLELTLTKVLAGAVAAPALAGGLIAYRLLYYLLPFLMAVILLGGRELYRRRTLIQQGGRWARRGWSMIVPRLAAYLALGGGAILLLSANTPMAEARRGMVAVLPLPFVEASHFVSSLSGALLIVLARGLQRGVRTAWLLSTALMGLGVLFSLVKGWDWEEAVILAIMFACLLSTRAHFYRDAALWTHRFTPGWWGMLGVLFGLTVWAGFFASRHVPYQNQLWWQFALTGDASRFLRAATGAACVLGLAGLAQALRPARRHVVAAVDWSRVAAVVQASARSDAALAWLGDKEFLFSGDGRSALMYADQGRSRIVMGDPLGDAAGAADLLWQFVEQSREEGMQPVFYQISVAEMPRLVDMGFRLYKLGEEATVPLARFTLEGSQAKQLRYSHNHFHRSGLQFRLWPAAMTTSRMDALKHVSDAWLEAHRAGEKGFSLGRFDPEYLGHFPCAVIEDATGRVLAFANVWASGDKSELSVDLMRHLPEAPSGLMEALFIELMLWGQAEGYGQFSLGMAPLSGLSTHPLAPLWHKLASGIFQRGGAFYNFAGLRAYKQKFNPEWTPRYLAIPGAWHLPTALLDATTLIGGGIRATFSKDTT